MVPRRVPTSTPVSVLLFRTITTYVSGLMTVEAENARSGPRDGERRSSHWRLSKTRRAVRRRCPQNPDLFQTTADRQLFSLPTSSAAAWRTPVAGLQSPAPPLRHRCLCLVCDLIVAGASSGRPHTHQETRWPWASSKQTIFRLLTASREMLRPVSAERSRSLVGRCQPTC